MQAIHEQGCILSVSLTIPSLIVWILWP